MPSDTYILTISDAGVSVPTDGSVTNAKIAADADIAFSKLAPLTSGNILVGNATNKAASVAVSGDITISNTGVASLATGAVVNADINASAGIAHSKLASMTSGSILVGNSTNVPASVPVSGDLTLSYSGSATIANDVVTYAKMQPVSSGYTILGKPTSGSGDIVEIGSSSYMLESGTGLLRQADAAAARSTLGLGSLATQDTMSVANGGTGQSSYTIGDIIYANGTTSLTKLADVATGNVLLSGGVGVAPAYGKVGLTTHVSGTLPVANGGTGAATLTGIIKGNGTSEFTAVTAPTGALVGTTDTQTLENKTFTTATFDTVAYKTANQTSDSLVTGEMRWNSTDKTLDLKLDGDVTLQVGQEQNIYVQNADTSSIPNGAAVYIFGSSTGDIPSVKLASSVNSLANKTLGVATQTIASTGYGYITLTGLVRGLTNTSGFTTSGMAAGDEIWLSTNGSWSNTQQSFINSQIKLGHVVQVSSTQGSILVNPRIIAGPSGQRVGGIIYSDSTSFLSSSTGNTTLSAYSVPATGWRNTGTTIHARYYGKVTTTSSPSTRRLILSVGGNTVFDSGSFTPNTTPTTLHWHIDATFSRVSNTELDVFVSLSGDGLNVASLHNYTQVTGLTLDTTAYSIALVGSSADASSAKAIGYDFSSISWDPT